MTHKLELTDDEFDGLLNLLKWHLDRREVELHHTDAFAYKDWIKTRIVLVQQIMAKLEQVRKPKSK